MLATISKALGLSTPPEQFPLMPRNVDLSGNIAHFSMPENFSPDMPAEDMIEFIDLNDASVFEDYQKFTLIRRWWDIKKGGFFGRDYGSIMMSMYIKNSLASQDISTIKPLDFIEIIIKGIEKERTEDPNPMLAFSIYNFLPIYQESWFNQQRWIAYNEEFSDGSQYSFLFAIPVSTSQYLVVEFVCAPDNSVDIGDFVENFAWDFISKIMNTFQIDYQSTNPVKNAVLKSDGPSLQQLIDDKLKQLEQLEHKN